MLNIYAQTLMTATRTGRCVRIELPRTRWWHPKRTQCIDLDKI